MESVISVIVPAYNAEKTIKRCINSIICQTYRQLEIIIVNDGSKDNTANVLASFQNFDNRIKLITTKNQGVSCARNTGIDNATGKYITFVDSDDYIDSEMYETLIDIIQNRNVKIAHCSYKNVNEEGDIISIVGNNNKIVEQTHDEAIKCLIEHRLFIGGICNKLYDATLFNDIRFDETIKYNEDVLANVYLFDKVSKSVYTDSPFYNYVAVSNSSTHSADSVIYAKQCLYVSQKIKDFLKGKNYEKLCENRIASNMLGVYRTYILTKDKSFKTEKKDLMKLINKYKSQGYYTNKRENTLYYIYKYFPHMFLVLFPIYDKMRTKKLDPEQ